jgi:hypothetical protein
MVRYRSGAGEMNKPKKKAKGTVMRRFRIDEISAVDVPAQKGAVITFTKRHMPVAVLRAGPHGQFYEVEKRAPAEEDEEARELVKRFTKEIDPAKQLKLMQLVASRWADIDDATKAEFLATLAPDGKLIFTAMCAQEAPAFDHGGKAPVDEDDEEIARRAEASLLDEVDPNHGVGDDPDDIPEDEEEYEMSKQDETIELTEEDAVRLIAKGYGCTEASAARALASAEDESPEAVQKLLDDPKVANALAQEHAAGERQDIQGSVRELIIKKHEAGQLKGIKKRSAHRDAFRELYGR